MGEGVEVDLGDADDRSLVKVDGANCRHPRSLPTEYWKLRGLKAWSGPMLRGSHKEHEEPQRYTKHCRDGKRQYCPGKFYREDGLAWKPCGLHRSRWSRRPWDFHAIAPLKGRSKGAGSLADWSSWGGSAPPPDLSSLEKTTRRETEGGGRGQRRSRRATDGARSGSRPPLRLCGPNFPRTLLGKRRSRRLWQIECVLPRCLSRFSGSHRDARDGHGREARRAER